MKTCEVCGEGTRARLKKTEFRNYQGPFKITKSALACPYCRFKNLEQAKEFVGVLPSNAGPWESRYPVYKTSKGT